MNDGLDKIEEVQAINNSVYSTKASIPVHGIDAFSLYIEL